MLTFKPSLFKRLPKSNPTPTTPCAKGLIPGTKHHKDNHLQCLEGSHKRPLINWQWPFEGVPSMIITMKFQYPSNCGFQFPHLAFVRGPRSPALEERMRVATLCCWQVACRPPYTMQYLYWLLSISTNGIKRYDNLYLFFNHRWWQNGDYDRQQYGFNDRNEYIHHLYIYTGREYIVQWRK